MNSFYSGKKIFLTGHTGFKGSWMCKALSMMGAQVMGYSLEPNTDPSLYRVADIGSCVSSVIGDIRDIEKLKKAVCDFQPDIVIHMAAQPIVRASYNDPVYTYETNVMGTVNILEAARLCGSVRSFLNVTTDKVYRNNEWSWGYRETDALDGYDPYSNSKSCSELVTASYRRSFFQTTPTAVSTARAGNVIGGGDFAQDRIIPDCVRAMAEKREIIVRNPNSIRPYQHVLEPIFAYLMIAEKQYGNKATYEGNYNVGPNESDCVTTGALTDLFCKCWGEDACWKNISEKDAPHEANFLKLDHSKISSIIGWHPRWNIEETMRKTVEWSKVYLGREDVGSCMESQIREYLKG